MSHITSKSYLKLRARLDKPPQGAPESDTLFKILEHLFTEREALLVSELPISSFTLENAAKIWKIPEADAEKALNYLADKGIIVDLTKSNKKAYILAPPMAGFFEFSIMKMHGTFDKQLLSELYHQYLNTEDEFGKRVFGLNPPIGRAFVHEDVIQKQDRDMVLDYERATKVIENATFCSLGTCYCRHKMEHVGKACNHSMEVCLTFNEVGKSLAAHKIAKEITKEEALKILERCRDEGLVQVGSNLQEGVCWICNCCGCCCEALLAYKKLGYNPRIETNWLASNNTSKCSSCGICVKRCPVNAISLIKEGVEDPKSYAKIDPERCIGCGVCTRFCPGKSLTLERRKETNFVPKDTFERFVLQAIDSGTLQNALFDNYHLWHYGVLRKFFEIIFRLPPAKWLLASKQLQSRFLTAVGNHYYLKDPELFNNKKPDYSHPEMKKKY